MRAAVRRLWAAVALCVTSAAVTVAVAAPPVFARVDEQGRLQVSATPGGGLGFRAFDPLAQQARVAALSPPVPAGRKGTSTRELAWQRLVSRVSAEVSIDARLLHAVIQTESAYNPKAVSAAGARGLMQLMPATATAMGVRDPHDPLQNVRGGARLLKTLLKTYRGDVRLALAAYNAGEPAVARHGGRVPDFPETQAYVKTVMARYSQAI